MKLLTNEQIIKIKNELSEEGVVKKVADKILIVVDMQNDFIDGALGTPEAQAILPKVKEKIENFLEENPDGKLFFTRDTHYENYLETQEGKNLPVKHCIANTKGWEIADSFKEFFNGAKIYNKPTFGSYDLAYAINNLTDIDEIELVGLCTGICVLANTVTLKTFLPEVPITIDASCCACVTPESHKTALEAMKLLQINVIGE